MLRYFLDIAQMHWKTRLLTAVRSRLLSGLVPVGAEDGGMRICMGFSGEIETDFNGE